MEERINLFSFYLTQADEAHRLKGKGAYQYFGKNQVEDIINAAKVSVFFVDDRQRIRKEDIGTIEEIKMEKSMMSLYRNIIFQCLGMLEVFQQHGLLMRMALIK